jgi:Tfp pilus assembly protein PilE
MTRRSAFTLIELLVATAIAMAMAALVTSAFIQVRKLIARAEATIAMNTAALSVYTNMDRHLQALQQSCAMVVTTTASVNGGGGEVRIIFMRGKEDAEDFQYTQQYLPVNTDLVWQEWDWRQDTANVLTASSTPDRSFSPNHSFKPSGSAEYQYQPFENLPQPRRTLSATAPTTASPGGLDDNIYFPTAAGATSSAADAGDVGDYTDLQNHLVPGLSGVTDWSMQIVAHEGTVTTIDDTSTTTVVLPGVWLDGRMADTLTAPPDYAHSALLKRPRLLRLHFTLTDTKAVIQRSFSFSFALPGLAPEP